MLPVKKLSFRKLVGLYIKDHTNILTKTKKEQNAELYKEFEAKTEREKNAIRKAKLHYFDLLEESLGKDYKDQLIYTITKTKPKYVGGVFDRYALNPEKVEIWDLSDQDLKDLFIKFVGYVGYEDTDGYAIIDPSGEIHPGEALPEPIDEITDEFLGIQEFQVEAIITYRDNHNILNIWGRGLGKTWKSSWIIEFVQKHECDKFLYFSLTDIAFIVANWVYLWAQNNNAIIDDDTVKVKKKVTGRKDSYQKFSLINGARFEVHGIRTSSTLGYHGWIIIFDDIIDISHKRLKKLQISLQNRWNSQYSKYRRKKFIMDNTRKFEGDFFDYMIDQFEKKGKAFKKRKGYYPNKYKLFIDLKTPYTDLQYSGDIEGYREFIRKTNKDQIPYDENNIIAPWYDPDDFEIMKLEDWESFQAEMMGNPKALEGGMVKPSDILYVQRPNFAHGVQMGGTGVDCASTEDESNDYTGIISCVMTGIKNKEKKRLDKQFTFYKSDVKRILARNVETSNENDPYDWIDDRGRKIRRGIFETVQLHCEYHKHNYPGITYIVAWERNNAGIALLEQALRAFRNKEEIEINKGQWVTIDFPNYFVEDPNQAVKWDKKGKRNIKLGVTHIKEKQTRIYAELRYPIQSHEVRFSFNQEDSLFMSQVLSYPRGKHDDGPDAGGMIKDELARRWQPKKRSHMRESREEKRRKDQASKEWLRMSEPWTAIQNVLRYRKSRKKRRMNI